MKSRLSIFLLLLFLPLVVLAQSEHLTFKGVPIDGTLTHFSTQLVKKGFTKMYNENGQALFQGDFAGYKDCLAMVSTLDQKDLVYMVSVAFPSLDQWALLESNYSQLKEMLTTKYGKPSEVIEEFQSRILPQNDRDKLYELKLDRCTYKTTFETEKGRIALALAHEKMSKCFVVLCYVDGINGALAHDAAMDDL